MSTWTADDLAQHYERLNQKPQVTTDLINWTVIPPPPARPKGLAPWTPKMNATERAYDAFLRTLAAVGEVLWWGFQAVTILIGPDCRFTPDFLILYPDGRLELHDTKGAKTRKTGKRAGEKTYHAEEDATIKARVTVARFPIPVYFVWPDGHGGWEKKGFRDGD